MIIYGSNTENFYWSQFILNGSNGILVGNCNLYYSGGCFTNVATFLNSYWKHWSDLGLETFKGWLSTTVPLKSPGGLRKGSVSIRYYKLTSTCASGKTSDTDSWSFVICLTAPRMAWDGIGALTSHCKGTKSILLNFRILKVYEVNLIKFPYTESIRSQSY